MDQEAVPKSCYLPIGACNKGWLRAGKRGTNHDFETAKLMYAILWSVPSLSCKRIGDEAGWFQVNSKSMVSPQPRIFDFAQSGLGTFS
jgi:hypothetical protein